MPRRVVLDTNALLMPFERKIQVERELERLMGPFEAYVPEACFRELDQLAREARGARRDRARAALAWAARFRPHPGPGPADRAVVKAAAELGAALLTNDKGVIREARVLGIEVVRLLRESHLGWENPDRN